MKKFSEYVSPGHPDKVADYISEYILDRYMEKDPKVRYAVEVMIKGNMVHLAGEVTGTVKFGYLDYLTFVHDALVEIGYTEEYYKAWKKQVINPSRIRLRIDISNQSPQISQGVDNDGWGDQGIFFGFADPDEDDMMPRSHSLAKELCHMLYTQAKEEGIGGLDIKTEIILDENGNIDEIIAAVPCRSDEEYQKIYESIERWNKAPIILNGTGNYVMHGPVADCGITGRKLAVDFYGGEFQVGGGSPWTKDGSKADLTLNLFARELAVEYAGRVLKPVKVSVACCIGRSEIVYSVDELCGENICSGHIKQSPKDLIEKYELNKPIYTSICTFGLFGKYNEDKKWERSWKQK